MSRPQSKYVRVDSNSPSGAGQCDRCGRWFNLRNLTFQMEWSGTHLYNKRVLVCTEGGCLDVPQEQFRTIILPPDPPPLLNARVPDFDYEEQTVIIMQFADILYETASYSPWGAGPQLVMCGQDGTQAFVLQYLTQSAQEPAPVPTVEDESLIRQPVVQTPHGPVPNINPGAETLGVSILGGPDALGGGSPLKVPYPQRDQNPPIRIRRR